jgi:hypothetical protein
MPDVGGSSQGILDLWHQQRAISSSFILKPGSLGVLLERPTLTPRTDPTCIQVAVRQFATYIFGILPTR